jgi:hypothetical protein
MNNFRMLCDMFTMLCIFRTQNKLYELSPFLPLQKTYIFVKGTQHILLIHLTIKYHR